jgi:hypothetical protein
MREAGKASLVPEILLERAQLVGQHRAWSVETRCPLGASEDGTVRPVALAVSASDQGEQSLHQLAVWLGQRFEDREMVGPVDRQQMPRQSALDLVSSLSACINSLASRRSCTRPA